jgi:hypothetical protein
VRQTHCEGEGGGRVPETHCASLGVTGTSKVAVVWSSWVSDTSTEIVVVAGHMLGWVAEVVVLVRGGGVLLGRSRCVMHRPCSDSPSAPAVSARVGAMRVCGNETSVRNERTGVWSVH